MPTIRHLTLIAATVSGPAIGRLPLREGLSAFLALLIVALMSSGCAVQPASSYLSTRPTTPLASQAQTADLEKSDRVARFQHLATLNGISPPQIDQILLPAGTASDIDGPLPVVRVVFDERVFFDFNSDVPRPEAISIIDVIAQNMRRDVPDAALTILGHTDAVGSDEYNLDLSMRRSANVLNDLVARGVSPSQLSTVAIGKRQPIAPNGTPEGRSRNRRVEFMISASMQANLAAVQQRSVPASYFGAQQPPVRDTVPVLTMLNPNSGLMPAPESAPAPSLPR